MALPRGLTGPHPQAPSRAHARSDPKVLQSVGDQPVNLPVGELPARLREIPYNYT